MQIDVPTGKYVVAVSGGVDSMVLLDVLSKLPGLSLTIAHYDHGIRPDAMEDRLLVEQAAARYGLPLVYGEGRLGPRASEAAARHARYQFLEGVLQRAQADAIITAHHQDDVLETAIINILRGTGRKGLTALRATLQRLRPFLAITKADIIVYAQSCALVWREDSTNHDERYLRNYIRLRILPRLGSAGRQKLLDSITATQQVNDEIDEILEAVLANGLQERHSLVRSWFIGLPFAVSKEVMAAWLRKEQVRGFDARTIERATIGAKTLAPGSRIDIRHGIVVRVEKGVLALTGFER